MREQLMKHYEHLKTLEKHSEEWNLVMDDVLDELELQLIDFQYHQLNGKYMSLIRTSMGKRARQYNLDHATERNAVKIELEAYRKRYQGFKWSLKQN